MSARPKWFIREDASTPVLLALALRQALGIRAPEALPSLRSMGARKPDAKDASPELERQWREYWDMTVEPRAHRSDVPLELVEGFQTLVALPAQGAEELRAAIIPHAAPALRYAEHAHARYVETAGRQTETFRGYGSAITDFERRTGRGAGSFELTVQVLPFSQRGIWWIGALTVAVTDGLRQDAVAYEAAITPIIAELA